MPNRLIKESICTSDTVNELSWFQEVCFYRLITVCDDYGRMDARPQILKGRMFPLKEDLRSGELSKAMLALEKAGLIQVYESGGKPYLQVLTWDQHQQIRAKKSKYPAPDIIRNHMISDDIRCARNPIQSESESESKKSAPAKRFAPPSAEEVAAYCRERGNGVNAEAFVDFYASKGWKVGKNPMTDWKAAVRTWEQRDRTPAKTVSAQRYTQRDYDEAELEERLGVNELFESVGG